MFLHLAQVRPAGDSGEMAQKNQQQRFAQIAMKPDRRAIRLDKGKIADLLIDPHRHHYISDRVVELPPSLFMVVQQTERRIHSLALIPLEAQDKDAGTAARGSSCRMSLVPERGNS
jgi:hypothetical protein